MVILKTVSDIFLWLTAKRISLHSSFCRMYLGT